MHGRFGTYTLCHCAPNVAHSLVVLVGVQVAHIRCVSARLVAEEGADRAPSGGFVSIARRRTALHDFIHVALSDSRSSLRVHDHHFSDVDLCRYTLVFESTEFSLLHPKYHT